ncbi:MAG: vitamin K epoxide reductase family protein [Patescibacteria group bacterium]
MQNTKPLLAPFYLIAATFIGIADTLYLSYNHFLNLIPSCAIGGCEVVLTHPSATLYSLNVPLAYLGLIYYAYLLCLGVLLAYDPRSKGLRLGMLGYTAIGLVCSLAFEAYQFFVIGAMCLYCGISATTTLVLFSLSVWHWVSTKNK